MSIARLGSVVRRLISRGKVTQSRIGARTLLQVTGMDGETKQTIELLLPPGYVARPSVGADLILLQVLGQRDHLVAIGGDAVAATVNDLADGEVGLKCGNHIVILRQDKVEIRSADRIDVRAPKVVLDSLPTSAAGLPPGTLWKSGDEVRQVPDA